jgi:hypothetical protein
MLNWGMSEYWITLMIDGVVHVRLYEGTNNRHAEAMARLDFPNALVMHSQPAKGWD